MDSLSPDYEPEQIERAVNAANTAYRKIAESLPWKHPIGCVQWVHIDRVHANDYNPNSVAHHEMRLLHTSIEQDGYTQPIVGVMDYKCDILLPCGHISTLTDQTTAQSLISELSVTPLVSSTVRAALHPLPPAQVAAAGGGSRSLNPRGTEGSSSVNGSGIPGESGESTSRTDSVTLTSGSLPESGISNSSWNLACPTCVSSDPERKKSWQRSILVSDEGSGPTVSWISFGSTISGQQQTSLPSSGDQSRQSDISGENSDWIIQCTDKSKVEIVDGFHRYTIMRSYRDIYETTGGYLPIVVIDKPLADRIASTVRHNRARGKHSVGGMSSLVFQMLEEGETDAEICNKIGLEPEELARLKHITGFAKLHAQHTYSQAYLTDRQIRAKGEYRRQHPDEPIPNNI